MTFPAGSGNLGGFRCVGANRLHDLTVIRDNRVERRDNVVNHEHGGLNDRTQLWNAIFSDFSIVI
jgi:hypothetical protein